MIELGKQVKDIVTGFSGIATARVEYLNGCVQYCVKPKMTKKDNGKVPDGYYFDEKQLVVIGNGVSVKKKRTGGAMSDVPADRYSA